MNDATQARLELARRNAARFIQNPNVKAIMVVGSVAHGMADDNSDIDCTVFVERPRMQQPFPCRQADRRGGNQDQQALDRAGEVLGLGVAVGVLGVGRPACQRQRPDGDQRRSQVDQRLDRVGQQANRVRDNISARLECDRHEGSAD